MPTVTLAIIAKDETDKLRNLLAANMRYFDAVQVAVDEQAAIDVLCVEFPAVEFFKYEWKDDFAHKRNFLASKCKTDFYFTVDTDDEILSPELIRKVAEDAQREKYNIVYGFYIYSKDADGNPNAAHWKERLVRNTPNLRWNKAIHENIIPQDMSGHNFTLDERLLVVHNKSHEEIIASQERNIKYLIDEYKRDGEKTDPRTIAYIGRVLFGFGDFKKARFFLEKHIQLSGWDEDRHLSWCQLADLHRLEKNYEQAIACAFEALQERPELPDAYLSLHNIYFDRAMWKKAIEWGEQGIQKEQPKNFIVTDPSSFTWRPALSLSYAYFNIGEFEKAVKLFEYAKRLAPSCDFIKQYEKTYRDAVEHSRYVEKLMWLLAFTKDKAPENVTHLVKSIPPELYEHSTVSLVRNKYLEPKKWDAKSIVIYCGDTPDSWSPKSITTGIGGSEEAVVLMAKEFTNLGYKVTVYNTCGNDAGMYDGVEYLNHVVFNPKDRFNILISWRCNIFTYGIQASRKIVWIHDLPNNIVVNDDTIKTFDKIVVLSNYHRSLLPKGIPDEKIYVSTNGLNPDDFVGLDGIVREPHRIIYASSYDRGLELILDNWKLIRESCPDAELHCYYGFNTYDAYVERGLIKDDGWKQRMIERMKQPGIFNHGRVGHKELLREYCKSSILAYPCTYAGEINCLALSKAIACGCFPLTNDFAVLPERNTYGKVVHNDKFIHALIALLRHGDTKINNAGFLQKNSWEWVAHEWDRDLFVSDVETLVEDRLSWTWRNVEKDKMIVDIGCNKGHVFEGWDRSRITSVDIDAYDLPNFVRADAKNLPFKDREFDYAVLAEIVEHTPDPIKVLNEARRVGKTVVVTVPFEYEWPSELEPFAKVEDKAKRETFVDEILGANPAKEITDDGYRHLFHETFYTPELLEEHLKLAGFTDFKITKLRYGRWAWLGALCRG